MHELRRESDDADCDLQSKNYSNFDFECPMNNVGQSINNAVKIKLPSATVYGRPINKDHVPYAALHRRGSSRDGRS